MLDTKTLDDPAFGGIRLRDYQQSVRRQVHRGHAKGHGQLIVAPTGSGKSAMGVAACHDWLADNPVGRVIWVALRRELLAQAEKEVNKMGVDVSKFDFVSAFTTNIAQYVNPEHDYLLVLDEAAHAACDTLTNLHNRVAPKALLGMSATPARADHLALGFHHTILESNYESLISAGFLSEYEHYTIPSFTPAMVARIFVADREKWGKTVLFFPTNAECKEFMELLPGGIRERVGFITTNNQRDSLIQRFKHNDGIDALVNVNILTEGYDEDSMDTVFIRRADSNTVVVQAAGRVMRLFKDETGKPKIKKVVQPVDSTMFYMTALPCASFDHSQDGWMRTDTDPNAILDAFVDVSDILVDIETSTTDLYTLLGC